MASMITDRDHKIKKDQLIGELPQMKRKGNENANN
jgi:hypothetical protein